MKREVAITGFGALSAFGYGEEPIRRHVFAGVPGFRPVTRFASNRYRSSIAAESDGCPRQREVLLACARAALSMAGSPDIARSAVLVGTQGDFTTLHAFWENAGAPRMVDIVESVAASQSELLAAALGIDGRTVAFNNGCVAGSNAIIHGCELIAAGKEDCAIAGGCYVLDEEFFAKFDSGKAFAKDGRLRAFSADRSGLLLGDGAAVLVLEEKGRALARGARCLATIPGWGMAGDGFHVCQPHPNGDGLAAAIRKALRRAGIGPEEVSYVNAHGTGTRLNDIAETRAIKQALGDVARRVPVSSTKTTTGHTLEASGALETVISLIALRDGVIPPTAGYSAPDGECDLDYVPNEPRAARLHRVLNVSSAFGGINTAILLGSA